MFWRALILLLAAVTAFSVRAQAQALDVDDADEAPPAAQRGGTEPSYPPQNLNEALLYELLLAEIAAQRGEADVAAKTYLRLARRTRDARVARRAVEVANAARAPQLALEAARIWQAAEPDSSQARRMLVLLLVSNGRTEEAEPHIAKLLASDANTAASGLFQLARLLEQSPDKAANLRLVQRIASRYPALPEAHFAVAQAAVAAKNEELAIAELRRAAELRPGWEQAAIFEAQLLRRATPGQALARLASFLERNPNARDARMAYARLLIADKRYADARAQFEIMLAAHKDDLDAIYAIGLLAIQGKEYALAESNLKRLLELGYRERDTVIMTLGQLAEEQKDWPRALDWYRQVQTGEQALAARLRTANVLARQGRLEDARRLLRGIETATPQQAVQLVIAEAQLLREANRVSDAFELLSGALSKDPDQPDLLYDHAMTAEKLDRLDVLEANLRKLIQVRPDHAHAYNALGYSLADRNQRLPEARKLIERAMQIAPDDYFIVDSMGWVLYRMGDLKAAADFLRRAWDGRQDAEIGAHFGEVLWMMGERGEAERIWKAAGEAQPDNETLRKTIQRLKR